MRKYETGDIVRLKNEGWAPGLYEVTGESYVEFYDYTVTNNECNTEHGVKINDIIFVASRKSRHDIGFE